MFRALDERATDLIERLKANAGNSPLEDRYNCGYIAAVQDILLVQLDDITKEKE